MNQFELNEIFSSKFKLNELHCTPVYLLLGVSGATSSTNSAGSAGSASLQVLAKYP